jgi:hypothetical protein
MMNIHCKEKWADGNFDLRNFLIEIEPNFGLKTFIKI